MALLQQDKAHSDRDRRFAGSQAIVGLLEGKTQPAGGLQHAQRRGLFHRRALIEHPVDGGYADARFTRNVGKGDFSGDFFQGNCRYE